MKKTTILFACMIALVALAAWAPNAEAFNADVNDCLACHDAVGPPPPTFAGNSSSPAHVIHLQNVGAGCFDCHVSIGDIPETSACGVCHTVPDIAVLHRDRNADPSCVNCHPGAPDPNDVDNDGDGVTENQNDCNDANPDIFPGATEICGDGVDQDCNGSDLACPPDPNDVDNDNDGFTENQNDCNDADADIFPGATEICGDGTDQDCNGSDLACPPDPNDVDNDNDGFTENQNDCNDADADIFPGATEICGDGTDQDCNGSDLACPPDPNDVDNDNDGFTENQNDCNDADADIFPGATEICGDGTDQDCNGSDLACVPDPDPDPNDVDNDNDGFTENQNDCNDADADIFPGATEICGDGTDQDCNGSDLVCPTDPNDVDDDNDGFTENQNDCNDADADIFPGATEICGDGTDQDCNGSDLVCPTDPNDVDDDNDGFTENQNDCDDTVASIFPGATEVCGDGVDQDCNGVDAMCPTDPNDVDNDGDGVSENQGDCDDTDASAFPGAGEVCGDGVDQDCDGADMMCLPDPTPGDGEVEIEEAEWEARDSELEVEGKGAPVGAKVTITDADTGDMIGTTAVKMNGEWELEVDLRASVPCRVRAAINGQSVEMGVEDAPCDDDERDDDERDDERKYSRWDRHSHD